MKLRADWVLSYKRLQQLKGGDRKNAVAILGHAEYAGLQ